LWHLLNDKARPLCPGSEKTKADIPNDFVLRLAAPPYSPGRGSGPPRARSAGRERDGTRTAPTRVRVPWSAAGYGRTRNGSLSTKLAS